ncbi:MAG: hypothetical protein OXG54_05470 [Gammaproteobacteria bacterium]|nr:hypothetical protein [Gammaproteobacteria bacterium]
MRLKRLNIQALPGIEPGFAFEPPAAGVNIVTGPNAIGKSSLARALGYLLRDAQKSDPPALSLEAEFESSETNWRVLRNGSQVAWYRNGSSASPPALPSADQIGLYRLSMESLLADDAGDKALAQQLRNRLRGDYDLDATRGLPLTPRFARSEEKNLQDADKSLREAERKYDALEQEEAEDLPRLEQEIKAAADAQNRCKDLELGLKLHQAVAARKSCDDELKAFPPGMDKLHGDEVERLENLEKKSEKLKGDLRERQRLLDDAIARLEGTGLKQSRPDPERLNEIDLRLQQLGEKVAQRNNALKDREQADAALNSVRKQFNETGNPPKLDTQSLKQAEAVAAPLLKAQANLDTLEQKLKQAGDAPDESEIRNLYAGGKALREWLAASAVGSVSHTTTSGRWLRIALWIVLVASTGATLLSAIQQALPVMVAALVSLTAAVWGLFMLRRRRPNTRLPSDEAKQRFEETGLKPPSEWTMATVRNYLQGELEDRYIELILQRKQAAQADNIRPELEQARAEVEDLQNRKNALAREVGFDPNLPSVGPDLFLQHCLRLNEAQERYEQTKTSLENVESDITDRVAFIHDFLSPWRSGDAPTLAGAAGDFDIDALRIAFQDVKGRVSEAEKAQNDINNYQKTIHSCEQGIQTNCDEIDNLFKNCALEADQRTDLDRRLDLLNDWREKRRVLEKTGYQEEHFRTQLLKYPEIIKDVDEDRIVKLQNEFAAAKTQADEHTNLHKQQTEIQTRLKVAGADHRLSQARATADSARGALQDKLEEALLREAAETLLNDVEQTFKSENEPEILSRSRALFQDITARAFDLELDPDGIFSARDLRQQAPREISELSSGTRMQLLLALRLAWTEAQEQGGETLPLFLDEALTTSDEERFAVMANSLERLAETEARQIFYLSARRHECSLWKHATGNEPPVIDLATVRFRQEAFLPQDYAIVLPPPVPSPDSREPEAYASLLGVPPLNPRLEPGAVHLFYLLRDDLNMLYQFMETWRITNLGQLEALLNSNAGPTAIEEVNVREQILQRSRATRTWIELWRRGRGRPVNRGVLEQCNAVSGTYIDRVTELAENLGGDGKALVQALSEGKVSRFHTSKIEELERWLADGGYTDEEDILSAEEHRRLTLQQAMSDTGADVEDLNRVITWLESACPQGFAGSE